MAWDWGNAVRGGATGAAAGSAAGPWGTVIGGAAGALGGGLTGSGNDHVDKFLDQIPDELKKHLMPYINEYQKNMSDPNAIINKIGSGYHESPGFKWKLGQGENAITNAAAAGGMAGTGQHQQQAGELAEHLADQDYWDFVNHGTDIYKDSLHGGTAASSDLGTSLANLLYSKAGLGYERGAQNNKTNSDLMSSILAMLTKNNSSGGSVPAYAKPTPGWGG